MVNSSRDMVLVHTDKVLFSAARTLSRLLFGRSRAGGAWETAARSTVPDHSGAARSGVEMFSVG